MQLTRIRYKDLNSRQKEIYNFQKVAGLLADYGFNCIKLADDWQGADFLAYHKDGADTLKVQLKGRPTICRKYIGKDLHLAFPVNGTWYLVAHDQLVEIISSNTNWLKTDSWLKVGEYSSHSLGKDLIEKLALFHLADKQDY